MSEFTDELKRLDLAINLPSKTYFAIEEKLKDWQPPKEIVEVPQFVADWFEKNEDDLSFKIWGYLINWKLQDKKSDFFKWMKKESECIEILVHMQDGYKVKKEQLYHVVLPEAINCYLNFRINNGDAMFGSSEEIGNYKTKFTEQEIKALDERYWQFAVPVDEV